MNEDIPIYAVGHTVEVDGEEREYLGDVEVPKPLPCPFCGSTDLAESEWYLEDGEHEAWECESCKSGAIKSAWNQRDGIAVTLESTDPWNYPDGDKNMPAPGQRVYALFSGTANPVIATPIHADGSHLIDDQSIYSEVLCWAPLTELPEKFRLCTPTDPESV